MAPTQWILATRGSALAKVQTENVRLALQSKFPESTFKTLEISTQGDQLQDQPLTPDLGKNFFTKEIEAALLAKEADAAVHSLKDLATELPMGLTLAAVLKREDPRDQLVSLNGRTLSTLPKGARVGTSSIRRALFIKAVRPDIEVVPIRGNIDTRLAKCARAEVDALVVAVSGVRRLYGAEGIPHGLQAVSISLEEMVPSAGQGAIGIEAREDNARCLGMLKNLECNTTRACVDLERSCLHALGIGCQAPLGVYAVVQSGQLKAVAALGHKEKLIRSEISGPQHQAAALGATLAQMLITQTV